MASHLGGGPCQLRDLCRWLQECRWLSHCSLKGVNCRTRAVIKHIEFCSLVICAAAWLVICVSFVIFYILIQLCCGIFCMSGDSSFK